MSQFYLLCREGVTKKTNMKIHVKRWLRNLIASRTDELSCEELLFGLLKQTIRSKKPGERLVWQALLPLLLRGLAV